MRVSQPYGKRYEAESFSEEPKRRYFIACEGKKTEYQYFKGLIEYRNEIGIHPLIEIIPLQHEKNTGSNPLGIYKEATETINKADNFFEGDFLCLIADRDRHSFTEVQFDKLVAADSKNEIRLIISNPCIEFWLLLHLCDCKEFDIEKIMENKKIGNKNQLELWLTDKLGVSYNKRMIHFEYNYKDKIKIAIANSKLYTTDLNQLKNKIGTNIALLIEEMLK